MTAEELLGQLTAEEKAALVSGTRFMDTNGIPRLGIFPLTTSDGPHGLRKQRAGADNGVTLSERATAFPPAATLASGWNGENAFCMGAAIAKECRHYGVDVLLAPGANIKRNPRAGRNFEYFSEDPLLSGELAAAVIRGVQSKGVGASLKHLALNNAENYRFLGDSVADMRAVREIYLRAFERAVKENPASVMCSYNKINGVFASENKWLLTDVLRREWGYRGLVMTDWGAAHDRAEGLKAGCDLEMPGDTPHCRAQILNGLREGTLPAEALDGAAANVLRLVEGYAHTTREEADFVAHDALSAQIAADCAVLLKNEGVLPLTGEENLLVAGKFFEELRYQGAGSSMVNPTRITTPKDAFDKRGIRYRYERGYGEEKENARLLSSAVQSAADADKILVFAGLGDFDESEGADRENLSLPQEQLLLISALVKTGKPVIVVLFTGSVVELPFADEVKGILNMMLPGQNGGSAAADLLYGRVCPSGRLAESWVKEQKDVPFDGEFSVCAREVYKESVFVGYRYYATKKKEVRYPFGYGLSYTSFSYGGMEVVQKGEEIEVRCRIGNEGGCDGAEVVELYVHAPETGVFKPVRELRTFTKVYLKAGEEEEIVLRVPLSDLCYFNPVLSRFVLESGEYRFQLCRDCTRVELEKALFIEGEEAPPPYSEEAARAYSDFSPERITDELFEKMSGVKIPPLPEKKPLTVESRFTDFKSTFFGRILFRAVLGMAKKQRRRARKIKDAAERRNALKGALFLERVLESGCPRSMSMSAGGRMPYSYAEGITHLANGHILRAIRCFMRRG